jgi:D-beta-D-heptose 7-phosphate kinase/D-beta-D-heptose 1-phosphate adenosyltransferase
MNKAAAHLDFLKSKIVQEDGLRRLSAGWRLKSKSIAFTNGCFDLLHVGHISTFLYCADRADVVVVGVNTDESVKRLKGEKRPLVPVKERAQMLAALSIVDAVVPFSADTPLEIIKDLVPDLLVKGGDWKPEDIVGSDVVLAAGGKVESVPFQEGWSTTELERRIREGGA